jgi:4-amino-4-deoxy-L-arabinose transferase-like glycosyltransferase
MNDRPTGQQNLHAKTAPAQGHGSAAPSAVLAFCIFAALFSVYLLTFSGIYHSSDEISMLVATDSIARRGAWDIDLIRWMGEQQGSFGPDGHLYSRKGLGTTLVAVPFYWSALHSPNLGNVQTAMLTNALVTALSGVLVYMFLRRLGYGDGVSLGTALAFGLATMAWPYARYLFSESLAGLALIFSAYSLLRYRDRRESVSLLLAGTGLGVALLARLNNAIVGVFLGLLLLVYLWGQHERDWRSWVKPLILFGLPVVAALVIAGWYNWLRFGSPLTTGYLPEERFATPFFAGFYGLTFSPGKGLFWYNPILLAALVGWPAFFRRLRQRAEALLVAAVVLSSIAFYASWFLWWAGHSWGPRFLVAALPFAILPLAPVLEAALRRRAVAMALGALLVLSVLIQVLGISVDFNLYLEDVHAELGLYHPATLFNLAYSPLLRQWAYVRPENLDLAWMRGGVVNWPAVTVGLGLVVIAGLALWAAWRGRLARWQGAGLLLLLATGALFALFLYAPAGDVAGAARTLAAMERPGEAAALTKPPLTEAFQDAYDGHLSVWGVPSKAGVGDAQSGVWVIGDGETDPAEARLQVKRFRLDLFLPPNQRVDDDRLPAPMWQEEVRLGDVAKLAAVEIGETALRRGEALPLAIYWRALAETDISYTAFVQAIDDEGFKATQDDRVPCNGGCPTTTWRPGDVISEWYDLPIHPDAPPGHYQLVVGMYDLATGERLPAFDAQDNVIGTYVLIGSVEVQP